ncbi:MAG: DJ-1 family glyoxalase III [Verrucomicrobiota bacterium]
MPTVVAILPEGFEELEAVAPIDLLRRAGAGVTIAALDDAPAVKGRNGMTLVADTTLAALEAAGGPSPDLLLLPGGPGVKSLRESELVRTWVARQAEGGRWLAAICAAPTVLHDAGLLAGRRFTAHFSVAGELPELLAEERVVVDGRLITSRGAGTAVEFGLALVVALCGRVTADEINRSICA